MSEETEAVGTVQDTFDIFLGVVEDYLKAFDLPQADIDALKNFTPFRSLLFDAAELAFAATTDINELNKVALGIGLGALVGSLAGTIAAPVGLAGVAAALTTAWASDMIGNAYDALELWNQSHAFPESEYQDWLNESKFEGVQNSVSANQRL